MFYANYSFFYSQVLSAALNVSCYWNHKYLGRAAYAPPSILSPFSYYLNTTSAESYAPTQESVWYCALPASSPGVNILSFSVNRNGNGMQQGYRKEEDIASSIGKL